MATGSCFTGQDHWKYPKDKIVTAILLTIVKACIPIKCKSQNEANTYKCLEINLDCGSDQWFSLFVCHIQQLYDAQVCT